MSEPHDKLDEFEAYLRINPPASPYGQDLCAWAAQEVRRLRVALRHTKYRATASQRPDPETEE